MFVPITSIQCPQRPLQEIVVPVLPNLRLSGECPTTSPDPFTVTPVLSPVSQSLITLLGPPEGSYLLLLGVKG